MMRARAHARTRTHTIRQDKAGRGARVRAMAAMAEEEMEIGEEKEECQKELDRSRAAQEEDRSRVISSDKKMQIFFLSAYRSQGASPVLPRSHTQLPLTRGSLKFGTPPYLTKLDHTIIPPTAEAVTCIHGWHLS